MPANLLVKAVLAAYFRVISNALLFSDHPLQVHPENKTHTLDLATFLRLVGR